MTKPRVKICCISSNGEARIAIEHGASALGLVGHMPSGPGVIGDELINRIARTVPPPISTFLLTSETKQSESGKDILIGSRSLIIQLINLNLIDEFQICIYPMIEGKGLPLFDKIKDRTIFRLLKTKIFDSGAIVLYYEPTRQ